MNTLKSINESFSRLGKNISASNTFNNVNLIENFSYLNNIDKDLINGAKDPTIPQGLTTGGRIKCSKSAINNLKYLLSKGKKCKLCLGSFVDSNGTVSEGKISHVWVEDASGNKYQTNIPAHINKVKKFKSITLNPEHLDRLEKRITKFVKYGDYNNIKESYLRENVDENETLSILEDCLEELYNQGYSINEIKDMITTTLNGWIEGFEQLKV